MKKWMSVVCILALILTAAGCGKSSSFDPSASCLYVKQNGTLTQAVVESFEQEYYSLDEFQAMTEKEIKAYNSNLGKDKISVNRLEVEENTLYLLLDFEDADTYSRYNEVYCFTGTVEEALGEGRSFHMVFHDGDYNEYSTVDVTGNKDDRVVILKEEGIVQLEKAAKYVSNNVEFISEHVVEVMPIEDDEEYAYIIY